MANPRFDKLSDPELVEICNSGPRRDAVEAFGSLYRRHRDYVTRVALRFCSDREIAADTLQETFIYLLRKFPPSGEGLVLTAQLQSLLYPVARNFTLTAVKRQRRSEQTVDFEPDQLPIRAPSIPRTRTWRKQWRAFRPVTGKCCCCDMSTACD